MPSDSEIAAEILSEEKSLYFLSFKADDAVMLGMNLRKRFRVSTRHGKGRGMVMSIQSIQGTTLFSCAVGEGPDISADSWARLEAMMNVVKRTGHSSYYVEKGIAAISKTNEQLGLPYPEYRTDGGGASWMFQVSARGSELIELIIS